MLLGHAYIETWVIFYDSAWTQRHGLGFYSHRHRKLLHAQLGPELDESTNILYGVLLSFLSIFSVLKNGL
jgi:hypothetical protein